MVYTAAKKYWQKFYNGEKILILTVSFLLFWWCDHDGLTGTMHKQCFVESLRASTKKKTVAFVFPESSSTASAAPPVEEEEEEEQEVEEEDIPDLTSFSVDDMKQWVRMTSEDRTGICWV